MESYTELSSPSKADQSHMPEHARYIRDIEPLERQWTRESLAEAHKPFVHHLDAGTRHRISNAINFARDNGLTANTVEQEDFRLPEFARTAKQLRSELDSGSGFVVLRDIPLEQYVNDTDAVEIIAWGLANYLGRPLRQGINTDRRLFSVSDQGQANNDPTRIGASAKRSAMHTDNGCLEPRPPCYIALMCVQPAAHGGESRLMTARTLFSTIEQERPDLLPLYFQQYAFRSPQLHVWPSGKPYIHKPIFEVAQDELRVHYARVMIEPGMKMAGTALTAKQIEALDYLDTVLDRADLCYQTQLHAGDMLIMNNLVMLHGREAFASDLSLQHKQHRLLKRIWMRRRHVSPGDDPVALDLEEYNLNAL